MTAVSAYIVFMELMSNFENLHDLGLPIPKFISSVLAAVNHSLQTDETIPDLGKIDGEKEEKE